jgi:hypothetical protein
MEWRNPEDRGTFGWAVVVHLLWTGLLVGLLFAFGMPCFDGGCTASELRPVRITGDLFDTLNLPIYLLQRLTPRIGAGLLLVPFDSVLYAWLVVCIYNGLAKRRRVKSLPPKSPL